MPPLEIVPEQERAPVAPSTVQPVAEEPPAILIEAAVLLPGPIFMVAAAPPISILVVAVFKRLVVPVLEVAIVVPAIVTSPELPTANISFPPVCNSIKLGVPDPVSFRKIPGLLAVKVSAEEGARETNELVLQAAI